MSMLNWYQLVLLSAIAGTIWVAYWALRHRSPLPAPDSSGLKTELAKVKLPLPDIVKLAVPVTDKVKDQVKALDKLFDENLISVEEYVELRKRALG